MAADQEDMQELGGQSSSSSTKGSTINDVSIPWTSSTTDDDHRNLEAAAESTCRNDDWMISIMAADTDSPQPELKRMQIQKVPRALRESERNKGCFDPRVVSIGPYHHGKPELEEGEKFKIRAACAFIADSEREPHEFYNMILKVVGDARNCYLEGSTDAYDDEAFAHMMFLDGCFVLQCILALDKCEIFFMELKGHLGYAGYRGILIDIMLLENQLPFLVLRNLIGTRYPEEGQGEELIERFIVRQYIGGVSNSTEIQNYYKNERADQPLHLLQLLRRRFLVHPHDDDMIELEQSSSTFCSKLIPSWSKRGQPKDLIPSRSNVAYSFSFRSAAELKARGIHFRPSTTFCLKDFTFNSRFGYGLLTLPRLRVDRELKYKLLNMMAYELAPSLESADELWICSYVCFMNSLINGAEDAIELRSHNIIDNFYGTDEEVAKVFNSVATEVGFHSIQGSIRVVSDQIQKHYNSRLKTWRAQLLHNYFTTPWSAIAFFAAIFALVLTFLQTFFPHK